MDLTDHASRNRELWNSWSAEYQAEHASQLPTDDPTWGVWGLPERELNILGDVASKDVLELGCGGAQWSIALTRRGARCVGLDFSSEQLRHARDLVARSGAQVELLEASAEAIPLPDRRFDLVFCDHGAMSFADPRLAVPEVARVLRPGGLFIFNIATPLLDICWNDATDQLETTLHKDYFGLHRIETPEHVSFQLGYGDWIRLFRAHGFIVEDLIELRPPADAATTYVGYAPLEWARRWPAEHIWKVRRQ